MPTSRRSRNRAAAVLVVEDTATLTPPAAAVAEVSNTPWSQFSQGDYTPEQWARACLIDTGQGDPSSKDRYRLPVKEPGGALNRNAVHAAAGRINQVQGVSPEKKKTAARKLAALYRSELGEDPPPALASMAGEAAGAPAHRGVEIVETPTVLTTTDSQPARLLIQLIKSGWSDNGRYYSEAVLKRDGPKTFPAGTLNFVDHATEAENEDRPAGSLTRLASVQTRDAYWDPGRKALMTEVRVFAPWRDAVMDWAKSGAIGMSIRAFAEGDQGKAEGQEGWVVNALTEGRSVDYVTKPAAGGSIVAVLEALGRPQPVGEARNIGVWLESRLHSALTQLGDDMYGDGQLSRPERLALSSAIGDALQAWTARVEKDAPDLFKRDLYDNQPGGVPAMASEAAQEDGVQPETQSAEPVVPQPPPAPPDPEPPTDPAPPPAEPAAPPPEDHEPTGPGQPEPAPTQEGQEMPEDNPGAPPPASPGSARQVIEAEVAQMRAKMALMEARETARAVLHAALSDGWIPPATITRITQSLMTRLPLTGGVLDEAELTKMAGRELALAETEIAEAMQAAGVGRPRDLGQGGGSYTTSMPGLGTAEVERRLEEAFMALGNSEKIAKVAAKGRD